MTTKIILYIMVAILGVAGALNAEESLHLEAHEEAYYSGQYIKAEILYKEALIKYPNSSAILYNLGNTHLKRNELGKAIFYYKKALKRMPRDPETRINLTLAKEKRIDRHDGERGVFSQLTKRVLNFLTLEEVMILGLGLLIATNTLFFIQTLVFKHRVLTLLLIVSISVLVMDLLITSIKYLEDSDQKLAVIIVGKALVRASPIAAMDPLFLIHDGMECKVLREVGVWTEIELSNHFRGWVPKTVYWKL